MTDRWEVERDRFGVMFSGPLEVGEVIEVVPAARLAELEADQKAAMKMADDVLRRLSEWDTLNLDVLHTDALYWQAEIAKVRDALRGAME